MSHLICLLVTLIVSLIVLSLLWWVLNMALGLLPAPINPQFALAIRVICALVLVLVIIYWLFNGMPCLIGWRA